MTEHSIITHLTAAWDDGTVMSGTFELACDGADTRGVALACDVAVVGTPTDDAAPRRLRMAITAALDVVLADVAILGDLDGEIDLLVRQLLGFVEPPTPVQQDKWRRFQRRPEASDATAALTSYLHAVEGALPHSALGGHWGVTVMGDGALIRLNVGDVEVFAVLDDGRVLVACQGEEPKAIPPYGLRVGPGLRKAPPTYALWIDPASLSEALADPQLRSIIAERIRAVWRRMPKANYHNPLTEALWAGDREPRPNDPSSDREHAGRVVAELVARSGGPDGTAGIEIGHLDTLGLLFTTWAEKHGRPVEGGVHFDGRPGFWHALQELCPIANPDRWNGLRRAVLLHLEQGGWRREGGIRGSAWFVPQERR